MGEAVVVEDEVEAEEAGGDVMVSLLYLSGDRVLREYHRLHAMLFDVCRLKAPDLIGFW